MIEDVKTHLLMYWSGRFNMHEIFTKPGEKGPFAPPAGWEGDQHDYRALMRHRYKTDTAARQQMAVVAMRREMVVFSGPYSVEASKITAAIEADGATG